MVINVSSDLITDTPVCTHVYLSDDCGRDLSFCLSYLHGLEARQARDQSSKSVTTSRSGRLD